MLDFDSSVLGEIVHFYTRSSHFNGIPYDTLSSNLSGCGGELDASLQELVKNGQVSLNFTINPHIKQFPDFSVEEQLRELRVGHKSSICIYPTEKTLSECVDPEYLKESPFKRMLALGKPQLEPIFFDLSVLESYFIDPRFSVRHADYSGSISYSCDDELDERDQILLETFGIGYDESGERVAVVFLRYLRGLTPEHQRRWHTYMRMDHCKMAYAYYQNSILGEWADEVSIYEAFIEELHHINRMTDKSFGRKLFRQDFMGERPEDFRTILRPTQDNFYTFVHVLDKMMSENISKDFFKGSIALEEEIERADGKIVVTQKGTVNLLAEWFRKNFRIRNEADYDLIFKPFREVRSLRQKPAHVLNKNVYDKKYFERQNQMIRRCYTVSE